MRQLVTKKLNKTVKERRAQAEVTEFYERRDLTHQWTWVLDRNGNRTNKTVKEKRWLPEGLSERDMRVLLQVKRRARRLDESVNLCGIKFGLSSLIGLFPVVGDCSDAVLSVAVLGTCMKVEKGLSLPVLFMMCLNIFLDWAVGMVPFLGDLADAFFRANARNYDILEKQLAERSIKKGIDPWPQATAMMARMNPQEREKAQVKTQPALQTNMNQPGSYSADNHGAPPQYESVAGGNTGRVPNRPTATSPAEIEKAKKRSNRRSWMSRIIDPQSEHDLEAGERPPMVPTRPEQ